MQGLQVPSLVGKLRSHMPFGQRTTAENRSSIVTNSIKSLKMLHIQKDFFKKGHIVDQEAWGTLSLLGQLEQNSKACRCYFYHPLLSQHLGSYPVPDLSPGC